LKGSSSRISFAESRVEARHVIGERTGAVEERQLGCGEVREELAGPGGRERQQRFDGAHAQRHAVELLRVGAVQEAGLPVEVRNRRAAPVGLLRLAGALERVFEQADAIRLVEFVEPGEPDEDVGGELRRRSLSSVLERAHLGRRVGGGA
jgi:hypothetical protein